MCVFISTHTQTDRQTNIDAHMYTHTNFQFTFASNTATIVGGCLVTSKYKLRLPAAFVSAFVISVSGPQLSLINIDPSLCLSFPTRE